MNKQKGFTLIELVVVIAIIAILAAIVLINVAGYLNKAKDATLKEDMSTLLTDAITYSQSNTAHPSTFDGVITDTTFSNYATVLSAITTGQGYTVVTNCTNGTACTNAGDTAWCTSAQEKANTANYFCVDSTGAKYESATAACQSGGACHS